VGEEALLDQHLHLVGLLRVVARAGGANRSSAEISKKLRQRRFTSGPPCSVASVMKARPAWVSSGWIPGSSRRKLRSRYSLRPSQTTAVSESTALQREP